MPFEPHAAAAKDLSWAVEVAACPRRGAPAGLKNRYDAAFTQDLQIELAPPGERPDEHRGREPQQEFRRA